MRARILTAVSMAAAFSLTSVAIADEDPMLDPATPNAAPIAPIVPPPKIVEKENQRRSILLGHNLTPSTETLRQGNFTVGNYAIAGGITNATMLAVSPWLVNNYGLYNGVIRHRFHLFGEPFFFQGTYLKSGLRGGSIRYKMEAVGIWLQKGWNLFENRYHLTLSLNDFYFLNETVPFSLRREPFNRSPHQLTFTTLQQFRVTEKFGAQIESGILGMNFRYPNYHLGASMYYQGDRFLCQVGYSVTGVAQKIFSLGEHTEYNKKKGGVVSMTEDQYYQKQVSIHPEIQVQYFF